MPTDQKAFSSFVRFRWEPKVCAFNCVHLKVKSIVDIVHLKVYYLTKLINL